jgi:hypothetical protein
MFRRTNADRVEGESNLSRKAEKILHWRCDEMLLIGAKSSYRKQRALPKRRLLEVPEPGVEAVVKRGRGGGGKKWWEDIRK